MRVEALYIYPVKACRALALDEAALGPLGLDQDRRFAFIDDSGRAVTQRDQPLLAAVQPSVTREALHLDCGGLAELTVPFARFSEVAVVDVWGRRLSARSAQSDVASEYLGMRVRLAMLDPLAARAFVDSKPVLVTTAAMLRQLGLPGIGMERFRANVVLDEGPTWRELRGRETVLEYIEPCSRCEVTTIDQASGARRGPEPLSTLHRRCGGNFGAYCRVARAGRLRRGEVLEAG